MLSSHVLLSPGFGGIGPGGGGNGGPSVSLLQSGDTTGAQNFGVTNYKTVGEGSVTTNELFRQWAIPIDGTIDRFFFHVEVNTLNGATTVTVRINGVATTITVSVGAGLTGTFSDIVNSVVVVAGDLLSVEIASAGSAGNIRVTGFGLRFTAS